MKTESTMVRKNWKVEVGQKEMKLTHSKRAGNEILETLLLLEDFSDLYILINAVAQLHPELVQ